MHLPLRKCYHVLKLSVVVVLIVTILTLFEHWRGGRRSARAQELELVQDDYEKQVLEDEARIIPGLGDGGMAAHLVGEAKHLGELSEKALAINVYLSDRIAYNRTLKDYRNPACARVIYDAELPSASVIIIFHNEPYSVVVRTIWSVVNSARRDQPWYRQANFVERSSGKTMHLGYPGQQDPASPFVYLKEIILVDDNSTLPELKGKLSHYIRTRLPPDLIRLLRLPERVGLTRARLAGARYAVGDVLVFLDAHCEGQPDWLRPILQRIKDSPHSVVVPIIDVIESSNFYYSVQDTETFQVGGFTFDGHFTWIDVPPREKKRRGSDIAPTWSPTMAGGLFAINREYYWELGAYDEQMAGWGGENLEMSFRIWQCGGTLETIPCSRVGHVFRSFHPYGLPMDSDTLGINTARMAEVWMDDYAELFYLHRPDLRNNPKIGDVTHRRILREKLKCKNFQWYLDHVYKEKFVPVQDVFGFGRFSNPSSGLCLDSMQRETDASPLGVYPCYKNLQTSQYFSLTLSGDLRDEEKCAVLQYSRPSLDLAEEAYGKRVLMVKCHENSRKQKWRYLATKQLKHVESQLCLDAGLEPGADVLARTCQRNLNSQQWTIDYSEVNDFHMYNDVEPSDLESRLQKLGGLRRKSRSLLSYEPETEAPETRRSHKAKRHSKKSKRSKKKRMKNKFILKLVRSVNNNTEEHLEADIHCKHQQLYPNNTFVRALVTILNDNNIKVINNGRVFEHNKVTDLGKRKGKKGRTVERVLKKLELSPNPKEEITPPPPAALLAPPPQEVTEQQLQPVEFSEKEPWRVGKQLKPGRLGAGDILPLVSSENTKHELNDINLPLTEPSSNKIIVEDFVELKQLPAHTQPPSHSTKKRKRRRKHTTASPSFDGIEDTPMDFKARASPQQWEDYMVKNDAAASGEDEAMLISVESEPHINQDVDHSHIKVKQHLQRARTHARPYVRPRSKDSDEDGLEYTKAKSISSHPHVVPDESEPVKVVMKSNLTFNLGDEFFEWKPNTVNDVAKLLGHLMMPLNSSRGGPLIPSRLKPISLGENNVARSKAASKLTENNVTGEDESSGSSENSSKDSQ